MFDPLLQDLNLKSSVIFLTAIWIFMEGVGDEIKFWQASWNFSTLYQLFYSRQAVVEQLLGSHQ